MKTSEKYEAIFPSIFTSCLKMTKSGLQLGVWVCVGGHSMPPDCRRRVHRRRQEQRGKARWPAGPATQGMKLQCGSGRHASHSVFESSLVKGTSVRMLGPASVFLSQPTVLHKSHLTPWDHRSCQFFILFHLVYGGVLPVCVYAVHKHPQSYQCSMAYSN